MEGIRELVEENVKAAQRQKKKWYDQTAREREFKPDEEVLVLLPISSNKLLAQWQGPCCILRRVGKVDYELLMPDKRKRKNVFNINMLKKWFSLVASCFGANEDTEAEEKEFVPTWQDQDSSAPTIGNQLSKERREQLSGLLSQFKTVMTSKCGRTTVCQHHIQVKGGVPVHQQPYHLRHMYRDAVEREIEMMLAEGTIEPCCSEWSSPIAVARKKDNTIQLCVDYRQLNAEIEIDAYLMLQVDDILDQVGQAKYIITSQGLLAGASC